MADVVKTSLVMPLDPAFWRERRVLVTGHTGFKGGWLAIWLARLGARVTGVALAPSTCPSLCDAASITELVVNNILDIRNRASICELLSELSPEIVFHLAAQPLVRAAYRQPVETYATNVMGTIHVLEAMRGAVPPRVAVMVTTDKVYEDEERGQPQKETDRLGGHDPYASSKAACELAIASYRRSFLSQQGTAVASVRAGNVIGGGDWSEDRLIPDAVRAWGSNIPLEVRRPDAVRPWQHVVEPLHAYLILAQNLWSAPNLADAYNIGPASNELATVRTVIEMARGTYGRGETHFARCDEGPHETAVLALDASRAKIFLGIKPKWDLSTAVLKTMEWYRAFEAGASAIDLCTADIETYERAL